MSLSALKLKKLTAAIGTCLVLGASGALLAQTDLVVENDGLGLTAFVGTSSGEVLSTSIRVIGPNDFVFEDRVEGELIDWVPEASLPDGIYTWEVWTVTAKRGAPIREFAIPQPESQLAPANKSFSDLQSGDDPGADLQKIPIERLFYDADKNVETKTGVFRMEGGRMLELEAGSYPVSQTRTPSGITRIAKIVLDFFVPTAQAQNLQASSPSLPRVSFVEDGDLVKQVLASDTFWWVRDRTGTQRDPFIIMSGAPSNSLRIHSSGRVGIGTGTPANAPLHIRSSGFARIRLDDPGASSNWYAGNWNAGRFEVAHSLGGVAPFAIQSGAPDAALYIRSNGSVGIGTDNPERNLHVRGGQIRLETVGTTTPNWDLNPGGAGFWMNRVGPNAASGVVKIQNTAPIDSLVANETGVGMGTGVPQTPLHVRRFETGTDTDMFRLENSDGSRFQFVNNRGNNQGGTWEFINSSASGGAALVIRALHNPGGQEFRLASNGNLTIRGSLTEGSSQAIKSNIVPLIGSDVLSSLAKLDIAKWSYNSSPNNRHAGPMAEQFYEVFGLGSDNKHIAPRDMAGLALAAAQALHEENKQLKERLSALEQAKGLSNQ